MKIFFIASEMLVIYSCTWRIDVSEIRFSYNVLKAHIYRYVVCFFIVPSLEIIYLYALAVMVKTSSKRWVIWETGEYSGAHPCELEYYTDSMRYKGLSRPFHQGLYSKGMNLVGLWAAALYCISNAAKLDPPLLEYKPSILSQL